MSPIPSKKTAEGNIEHHVQHDQALVPQPQARKARRNQANAKAADDICTSSNGVTRSGTRFVKTGRLRRKGQRVVAKELAKIAESPSTISVGSGFRFRHHAERKSGDHISPGVVLVRMRYRWPDTGERPPR